MWYLWIENLKSCLHILDLITLDKPIFINQGLICFMEKLYLIYIKYSKFKLITYS